MEKDEIEKIVDERINTYRKIILAFFGGLILFISLGALFPKQIILPMIESIYTPDYIYRKNRNLITSDSELISDLFNDSRKKTVLETLKDHRIKGVGLHNFPKLYEEFPEEIWKTIEDGDKEKYDSIVNEEFMRALKDKFFAEMQLAFATDDPLRYDSIRNAVLKYGSQELKARLTMVAPKYQGKSTSCNINFDHDLLEAIVVLPKNIDMNNKYKWLRCPGVKFPYTELKIRTKKIAGGVSEIQVVGVETTGESGIIELRLSKKAAEALEMKNAKKYLASGFGKFKVSKAK